MIPDKVRAVLDAHGLEAIEFEEGSTPTAELAATRLGVAVGNIAKSLLFLSKDGRFFMVVCPGDRKVSNSKLKKITGVKTRMARAEETLEATGYRPGGVCPFAVEGVQILVDTHLSEFDTIYPAAGTDSTGVPMTYGALLEITGGTPRDCTDPIG